MDAQHARQISSTETFKQIMDLINEAADLGETEINVNPSWVTGIKGQLVKAGYRLRKWEGWVEISW